MSRKPTKVAVNLTTRALVHRGVSQIPAVLIIYIFDKQHIIIILFFNLSFTLVNSLGICYTYARQLSYNNIHYLLPP